MDTGAKKGAEHPAVDLATAPNERMRQEMRRPLAGVLDKLSRFDDDQHVTITWDYGAGQKNGKARELIDVLKKMQAGLASAFTYDDLDRMQKEFSCSPYFDSEILCEEPPTRFTEETEPLKESPVPLVLQADTEVILPGNTFWNFVYLHGLAERHGGKAAPDLIQANVPLSSLEDGKYKAKIHGEDGTIYLWTDQHAARRMGFAVLDSDEEANRHAFEAYNARLSAI